MNTKTFCPMAAQAIEALVSELKLSHESAKPKRKLSINDRIELARKELIRMNLRKSRHDS